MTDSKAPKPSELYTSIFGERESLDGIDTLEDFLLLEVLKNWNKYGVLPKTEVLETWKSKVEELAQAEKEIEAFYKDGERFESDEELSKSVGKNLTLDEAYGNISNDENLDVYFTLKLAYDFDHATIHEYAGKTYIEGVVQAYSRQVAELKRNVESLIIPAMQSVVAHMNELLNSDNYSSMVEELRQNPLCVEHINEGTSKYLTEIAIAPNLHLKEFCYDNMVYMQFEQCMLVHDYPEEKELLDTYFKQNGDVSSDWIIEALSFADTWWT